MFSQSSFLTVLLTALLCGFLFLLSDTSTAHAEGEALHFSPYTSYPELVQTVPDAREIVEKYASALDGGIVEVKGAVAVIPDTMVLFYFTQPQHCGALGCTLAGFSPGQDGFYQSLYVIVPQPVRYAVSEKGALSLFLCTSAGLERTWAMDAYGMMDVVRTDDAAPQPCQPTIPPAPKEL